MWDASYREMMVAPTNSPASQLRRLRMSLRNLDAGCSDGQTKEMDMEFFAGIPEWLVWCAASAAAAIALATLAGVLDATLELAAG
jgi:hypothetical protein